SEGEGACLSLFADRSHLPLRGKQGWMTPRAGVKTTPATETRLQGPPIPSEGPSFFHRAIDSCKCSGFRLFSGASTPPYHSSMPLGRLCPHPKEHALPRTAHLGKPAMRAALFAARPRLQVGVFSGLSGRPC